MSPIDHVWDLVGWRLACDPRPAASKDELLLRIQAIRDSISKADIQNLLDFMPRQVGALISARGGYTKYGFLTFNIVSLISWTKPRRWNRTTLTLISYGFEARTPDHRCPSGLQPLLIVIYNKAATFT
ncbi:transposable element Tcb1 transposase [Trichonephila clavipes]|nr:transposable element Tcb1 transposase [Trichonephila clavipes]